jgi:hypothetical protein
MMALDVTARLASDSVMPPTPEATTTTLTSSLESLTRASRSASTLPWTSALRMMLTVFSLALLELREELVQVGGALLVDARLALALRAQLGDLARLALVGDGDDVVTGIGHADRPSTCTGIDGPASSPAAGLVEHGPHPAVLRSR